MLLAKGSVPSPRTWWMIQSGGSCVCLTFVMGFTCHYSVSNDKPVPDSEAFVETSEGWMVDLSSSLVVVGLELWQEEFKCFCSSSVKILSSHVILVFGFLCSGKHHAHFICRSICKLFPVAQRPRVSVKDLFVANQQIEDAFWSCSNVIFMSHISLHETSLF